MFFQNETTDNTTSPQSKKSNFMKWVAIFLVVLFVLLCMIVFASLGPSLFIALLMGLGAPGASPLLGLLVLLVALAVTSSPFVILGLLFFKEKYLAIILFTMVIMVLIGVFGGKYVWRPLELTAGQVGISLPDNAPSGILTLPEDFIPKNYYLGEKGAMKKSASGEQYYFKGYYMKSQPLNIIRLTYYQSRPCYEFKYKQFTKATCKIGECVISTHTSGASDGKNNFQSRETDYAIDDHGSCAKLHFSAFNAKDALSEEQILSIVNSLQRTPVK